MEEMLMIIKINFWYKKKKKKKNTKTTTTKKKSQRMGDTIWAQND